jgi:7-cyano-7-deazaguanine synthase
MSAASSKAVVLLSGGLDSYTAGAMAREAGFDVYALTVKYGQRHAREIIAARQVAEALGAKMHREVAVDLATLGGSALLGDGEVPKSGPDPNVIPVTYVPARNTVLLAIALAWAEVLGAYDIFLGVNVLDYSGYPDCRAEFIEAFENLSKLATKAGVEGARFRIQTPLISLTKAEIIKRGMALGLDYGLTHSCYDPQPHGTPCGRCDSCVIRARGFQEAGVKDPLVAHVV